MSMLSIDLSGTPYEMGVQHGRQVQGVQPLLAQVIATRWAELRQLDAAGPSAVYPPLEALRELDRPLLDFLHGLAESLALDYEDLIRYTLSSYLKDLHRTNLGNHEAGFAEGCTTWTATGPVTQHGSILLVKNRDYHRDHIPLQLLARVTPAHGHRYLTLGSAGSPHVFSSGINERGLAVADTHVLSRDLGPGLPRFSLMRNLMEHHARVDSALDYLRSATHMGGGTITLADATGHLAVCESGHQQHGYRTCQEGYLISTNHFISPELANQWIEDEAPALRGNSPARYHRVENALENRVGKIDLAWAQSLTATHGSVLDSICRHPPDLSLVPGASVPPPSTISAVILLPAGWQGAAVSGAALLAVGMPCQANWQEWQV